MVDPDLWEDVQALLTGQAPKFTASPASEPSLPVGRLFNGRGRPMTPSHGTKGSRRYRYYHPDRPE